MEKNKAYIDYIGENSLELAETMDNTADGMDSDEMYGDCSVTSAKLRVDAGKLRDAHKDDLEGGKPAQVALKVCREIANEDMHTVGVWANFKCAGSELLLTNLKIPFYDASTSGKSDSAFSLKNGPNTGELLITVPTKRPDASFIVMYSLEAIAPLNECILAGANSHCSFSLTNLPVGVIIYVRWAAIGAWGIGEWSVPHPIIVT